MTTDANYQRLKVMRISRWMLIQLFKQDGSSMFVFDGMPQDAELIGISDLLYFDTDQIALKVRSAEFHEVPDGTAIPELTVTVREAKAPAVQFREFI